MHSQVRRFWCRAGFLLGCLLPTLVVGGWLAYQRTDSYRATLARRWSEAIAQRLGVRVSIDDVTRPEPGLTRLTGVLFLDPETGERLASTRRVEVAQQGSGWLAYCGQAEVPAERLARLAHLVHDSLLARSALHGDAPSQLILHALTLEGSGPTGGHSAGDAARGGAARTSGTGGGARGNATAGGGSQTLEDLQLVYQPRETGPRTTVEFRLAGVEMSQPARLVVARNRQSSPAVTSVTFDTGPHSLPCSLLATVVPGIEQLGRDAQVGGEITLTPGPDGWQGQAHGRITRLDLDSLLAGRFPHKLTGVAEIVINRARWEDGRLLDASGAIATRGGVVSRSLLIAASDESGLKLGVPERVRDSKEPLWRYRELGLGFELSEQGLQLAGQCGGESAGAILIDGLGALASESSQPLRSIAGLLRTLAPQNEIQVPASAQTESLLRRLPLPPLVDPPPTVARPRYIPLRLR